MELFFIFFAQLTANLGKVCKTVFMPIEFSNLKPSNPDPDLNLNYQGDFYSVVGRKDFCIVFCTICFL